MDRPAIICVDNEPSALERLRSELNRVLSEQYSIETAKDGREALELLGTLQREGREVALVLVEYILPDMQGDEVLRHIHDRSPHTLNIMVSRLADLDLAGRVLGQTKLYRCLLKPWQPEDLQLTVLGAVQQYLRDRRLVMRCLELQQINWNLQRSLASLRQAEELWRQQSQREQALNRAVQQLNQDLEFQVQTRTAELQQALEFEALLKRITDKVRDSLDEGQILQTVVQELQLGLNTCGCDVALYQPEQGISVLCYEASTPDLPPPQDRTISLAHVEEMFTQIYLGEPLQFCLILPTANRRVEGQFAILSCPIVDDRTVLGDLWLFRAREDAFLSPEIRLVKQVANQCAIALRQSRLYQAAQTQVEELERLNRLKDDFLSSVSHELRSPMSNIKMATQMLELALDHLDCPVLNTALQRPSLTLPGLAQTVQGDPFLQVGRYVQILKDECQRETELINDLLDLARLEAGTEPLCLTSIGFQNWLLHIVEPFIERMRNQQQQFELHLPSLDWNWTTDLSYLERILTELLHNACKYTPAGKTITLSASLVSGEQRSGESEAETWLQISLKNAGIEIPRQECDRIFDKFYRIPNNDPWKHGGTGLGLALVKKQIEQLQGTIEVQSQSDWTCFIVSLPQLQTVRF